MKLSKELIKYCKDDAESTYKLYKYYWSFSYKIKLIFKYIIYYIKLFIKGALKCLK